MNCDEYVPKTPSGVTYTASEHTTIQSNVHRKDRKLSRCKVQDIPNFECILKYLQEPEWNLYMTCPSSNLIEDSSAISWNGADSDPSDILPDSLFAFGTFNNNNNPCQTITSTRNPPDRWDFTSLAATISELSNEMVIG